MPEELILPTEVQERLKQIGQLGVEVPAESSFSRLRLPEGGRVILNNGQTVDRTTDVTDTQLNQKIQFIGSSGDDILEGTNGTDEIFGLEGNDQITSYLSSDWIYGGPGDDNIVAGGGDDYVEGGSGIDLILGDFNPNADPDRSAMGNDTLKGGDGKDYIFGQNGDDILEGENGSDILYGGNGNDTLDGGRGNDLLEGGEGNDRIFGANGHDTLRGDDGDDRLDGGAGNDKLFSGRGNDYLFGRLGDDELSGGLGNDTLEGGQGNDVLIGVDATTVLPIPELGFGNDDIDTLIGNEGNDTFVLGTQLADGRDFAFYNDGNIGNAGLEDYALIKDFGLFNNTENLGFDKIQLAGLRSSYSLGVSPIDSSSGTAIFYTSGQTVAELIGIVENISVSQLSLENPSQFTFV
ncbi:MAG: calcium-binding protein [Scytonema sp. PMC 1069.18]|nr:calcium-binding protein [Scytonema sp. PMC 1069.18]MEC4885835.1 calcium-binding protein [Scytonema sp. PMC 1070.18]